MTILTALLCPVCGAPMQPGADRCTYCGSVVFIKTDHPRIDASLLNKAVIDQHIAEFRKSVRSDPNDEVAHYGLGVAYFNLGLSEEAADELVLAARLMPENPHIQTQLAVVLAKLAASGKPGREHDAWDRVDRALTLDPTNFEALILKAELLDRRGDTNEAMVVKRRIVEINPSVPRTGLASTLITVARQNMLSLDVGRAMSGFRSAAEIDPESVRTVLVSFISFHAQLLKGVSFPLGNERKASTLGENRFWSKLKSSSGSQKTDFNVSDLVGDQQAPMECVLQAAQFAMLRLKHPEVLISVVKRSF